MPYAWPMNSVQFSRRHLVALVPTALVAADSEPLAPTFPTQSPELAKEMVGVSHGKIDRVRELLELHPSLAKAAWDWGFGDWETALGAASHVGNREIAELLLATGATPTLFSAAMLGHRDTVKAMLAAQSGLQRTRGPHSIPLLAHARAGGKQAEPVLRYLESLGDAGSPPASPLTEAEASALGGTYHFGPGPTDSIEIRANKNQLGFLRQGTDLRGLIHLGEHVFHPAGAEAVRIRFAGADGATVLTVHDPSVVLTATKSR